MLLFKQGEKFLNLIPYNRKFITWVIFFLILLPKSIFANPETRPPSPEPEKNVEQLTNFLDKLFAEQMQKQHIPGLAIVIVKDGQVLLSKGYGYADIDKGIPIDASKTLFRVASISKLFTATAIMQLVQQGKLDLKENVNHYLKNFKLDNHFKKPITVADLLLHTAGFEDNYFSSFTHKQSEVLPLEKFVQKYQPLCVYPPNEVFSYSNYGYALAGHLIEIASGLPFETYIEENIFRPLAMKNSSFNYPETASGLATGYQYQEQHYKPVDFYFTKSLPSMGLVTSATDLAPFMMAHLQKGQYQNKEIFNQQIIELMQKQQFTGHPKLPGNTFGFRDLVKNEQRAIRHDGRIKGFQSLMYLIPEQNLGFFLVYNSSENSFYLDFTQAFLNYYFPIKIIPPTPINNYQERAQKFVGSYRNLRYSHSTIEKLDTLVSQYSISANKDGTITLYSAEKSLGNWLEVEPLLFKKVDEDIFLAFREDKQGQIAALLYNYWFLEKLPFYEAASFQFGLIYFFIVTFFITFIWQIFLVRKRWKENTTYNKQLLAQITILLVSLLDLFFLVSWLLLYQVLYEEFIFKIPFLFILLLCLPIVSLPLTISLPIWIKIAWNYNNNLFKKLYFCFFALITWLFIPFLYYWNLLGFKFYN